MEPLDPLSCRCAPAPCALTRGCSRVGSPCPCPVRRAQYPPISQMAGLSPGLMMPACRWGGALTRLLVPESSTWDSRGLSSPEAGGPPRRAADLCLPGWHWSGVRFECPRWSTCHQIPIPPPSVFPPRARNLGPPSLLRPQLGSGVVGSGRGLPRPHGLRALSCPCKLGVCLGSGYRQRARWGGHASRGHRRGLSAVTSRHAQECREKVPG